MNNITGYINNEFSSLQPLAAEAILESGVTSGLSSSAVVKVTIPNLSVLRSTAVTEIIIDDVVIFPGTSISLGQIGNSFYFSTDIANDAITGKVPVVAYVLSPEDYAVARAILATSSLLISSKTVDLEINVAAVTIAGSSFTPPITNAPSIGRATQWTGDSGLDVSEVIQGYIKNGVNYDVIITPLDEAIANVKISII